MTFQATNITVSKMKTVQYNNGPKTKEEVLKYMADAYDLVCGTCGQRRGEHTGAEVHNPVNGSLHALCSGFTETNIHMTKEEQRAWAKEVTCVNCEQEMLYHQNYVGKGQNWVVDAASWSKKGVTVDDCAGWEAPTFGFLPPYPKGAASTAMKETLKGHGSWKAVLNSGKKCQNCSSTFGEHGGAIPHAYHPTGCHAFKAGTMSKKLLDDGGYAYTDDGYHPLYDETLVPAAKKETKMKEPGGAFDTTHFVGRQHQTAVIFDLSSLTTKAFRERINRVNESVNHDTTIKADVIVFLDPYIVTYNDGWWKAQTKPDTAKARTTELNQWAVDQGFNLVLHGHVPGRQAA